MEPVAASEVVWVVGFFGAVVAIVKILSDNWTRRKIVAARMPQDELRELFAWERDASRRSALKWGLLLAGVGAALVVIAALPIALASPLAYGLVFLFAGAGLLAYHAVSGRTPSP